MLAEKHTPQQNVRRKMFGTDLRTLAVFRMGLAVVLCGDLIERLINVRLYYTEAGLLPKLAITQIFGPSIKWTSLHYHTGGSSMLQGSMILAGISLTLALFVGYRTRVATILSWLLFISLNRRVSGICTGGDDLMRLMLLWSVFLPLGARWSWDARNTEHDTAENEHSNRFISAGTCAIFLQVAYVYFFTAIIKFAGQAWLDGSAIQEALRYEVHVRPLGLWLSNQTTFLYFLTFATLIVELCVPFLVFSPIFTPCARWLAIATMISFHLGIFICLTIGTFPFVCIACWLLFVPTETWDWLEKKRNVRAKEISQEPRNFAFENSKSVTAIVLLMLLFVTVYNVLGIEQLNQRGIGVPKAMSRFAKLTRLDQKWKMYAPNPASTDGWFLMPCRLADGTSFDIYRNQRVSYSKPRVLSAGFPSARLKKLFLNHRARNTSPLWMWVMKYYTDQWNTSHPDRPVVTAQMMYMWEPTHNAAPIPFPYMEYDVSSGAFSTLSADSLVDR